eukprot:366241-Chlamydomonas_euryale.AAC.12
MDPIHAAESDWVGPFTPRKLLKLPSPPCNRVWHKCPNVKVHLGLCYHRPRSSQLKQVRLPAKLVPPLAHKATKLVPPHKATKLVPPLAHKATKLVPPLAHKATRTLQSSGGEKANLLKQAYS